MFGPYWVHNFYSFVKIVPLVTVIEYIMSNNFLNYMEACLINSEILTYVQIVALTQEFLC